MGQCYPRVRLSLRASKKARKGKRRSAGEVDLKQFSVTTGPVKTCSPLPQLPVLEGRSKLLTPEDIRFLAANAPFRDATLWDDEPPKWRLLYCLETDARSFQWLRHTLLAEGPTLIVVETEEGHVFGGFSDTWMPVSDNFYGNSNACALFKLRLGEPKVYTPTYQNSNYQYLNLAYESLGCKGGIAMGGQHGFYTWRIDQDLKNGECCGNPSSTFGCPLLCGGDGDTGNFKLRNMEVWCVAEPPADNNIAHLRLAKAENAISILELYKAQFGSITGKAFYSDNLAPPVRERGKVAEPEEIAKEIEEAEIKAKIVEQQQQQQPKQGDIEMQELGKDASVRKHKHKKSHKKHHSHHHKKCDNNQVTRMAETNK